MALDSSDQFKVVTETDEEHEAAHRAMWVAEWTRELEVANTLGDKDRASAAEAELARLGVTRAETHRGPERAVRKPRETRKAR